MLLRFLLWLLVVFWLAGCGGDGGTQSFQAAQAPTGASAPGPSFRGLGDSVTRTVGAAGGSVELSLSDGTRFVFTIPAGALAADTEMTFRPVAVGGRLGLPVQMPLALQISPSGTRFVGGAQLAITLPPGQNAADYHPYLMEDSGSPMSLTVGKVSGQTLTFQVFHLSVPGIAPGAPPSPASTAGSSAVEALSAEIASNSENQPAKDALLRDFAARLAERARDASAHSSETPCQEVIEDFTAFRLLFPHTTPQVEAELRQLLEPLVVATILHGIEIVELRAVGLDDWRELKAVNDFYLVHAQRDDLDVAANHLDTDSVRRGVPLSFVVDSLQLNPTILDDGQGAQASFRVGYRLGTNAVHHENDTLTAQLDLDGGVLTDQKVKGIRATTPLVYNGLFLDQNSTEVNGRLTVFFLALPIGRDLMDNGNAPFTFKIPGKLKVAASSGTPSGGATPVRVSVTKGRGSVAGTQVNLQLLSGTGSLPPSVTTDAQGQATVQFSGGSGTIVASVDEGGQQASTNLLLQPAATILFPQFYGRWRVEEGPARNYQFAGDWREVDKDRWRSGGMQLIAQTVPPGATVETPGYLRIGFDTDWSDPDQPGLTDQRWRLYMAGGPNAQDSGSRNSTTPIYRLNSTQLGFEGTTYWDGGDQTGPLDEPYARVVAEFKEVAVDPNLPPPNDPTLNLRMTIYYLYLGNLSVSFELPAQSVVFSF